MSPKTTEATGYENESKCRSGRGTGTMAAGKATRGRDMSAHKQNTLPQALPAGAGLFSYSAAYSPPPGTETILRPWDSYRP